MSTKKIAADLDAMIKRASEKKAEVLKKTAGISAKLDGAEDGTSPSTTGEQAADNKKESGKMQDNSVDGGAKDNKEGKTLEVATDGAKAVATDGQEGGKSEEFKVKSEEKPGDTENVGVKVAAARKLASDLSALADSLIDPLGKFLVKAARASADPKVKTAAEGMPDDQLADQASDVLMEQLQSGQISDEEAEQILQEAVQAGAISPEEIQEAVAMVGQEGAAPAPAADAGLPPVEAAPVAPEAALPEEGVEDPVLEAKLAAAQIGPDHPEYLTKLAHVYEDDIAAGAALFDKIAEELIAAGEKVENPAEKKEEVKEEAKAEGEPVKEEVAEKHEASETPAQEKKEETGAQVIDAMAGANLAPTNPEEAQALEAVKAELGLSDEDLKQLAATPLPPQMDKVASAKANYRTAILSKIAALQK
jgi:hypothetical protein